MSQDSAPHPNVKTYLVVFGLLMVLTVVTVTVSWLHMPPAIGILIGMMIATVKVGLVAAFFMHLKGERAIIYGFLGVTAFFMVILFLLPISDSVMIETRLPQPITDAVHGGEESH